MRRSIGPFLATGIALAASAAIVANPVVPPPADFRVSATDLTAEGAESVGVLDPEFLKSIGATTPDWGNPLAILAEALKSLTDGASTVTRHTLAAGIAGMPFLPGPAIAFGTLAAAAAVDFQYELYVAVLAETAAALGLGEIADGLLGLPFHEWAIPVFDAFPAPADVAAEFFDTITDISTAFGVAGTTFIKQVGLLPAVVSALADRVQAGTMRLDQALGRLALAPLSAVLTGHPALTGVEKIDESFREGALQPVIDAVTERWPSEPAPDSTPDHDEAAKTTAEGSFAPSLSAPQGAATTPPSTTSPEAAEPSSTAKLIDAPSDDSAALDEGAAVDDGTRDDGALDNANTRDKLVMESSLPRTPISGAAVAEPIGGGSSEAVDDDDSRGGPEPAGTDNRAADADDGGTKTATDDD